MAGSDELKNNVLFGLGLKKNKCGFTKFPPKNESSFDTFFFRGILDFFVRGNTLNRFRLVDLGGCRATQKSVPTKTEARGAEKPKSEGISNSLSEAQI